MYGSIEYFHSQPYFYYLHRLKGLMLLQSVMKEVYYLHLEQRVDHDSMSQGVHQVVEVQIEQQSNLKDIGQ